MALLVTQPDSRAQAGRAEAGRAQAGGTDPAAPEPDPTEPASAERAAAGELARLLFGRDGERERVHGTWRRLISDPTFRHHPDRTPAEQAARSYEWLRLVNDTLDEPERLAADPALLAGLHEWAAIVEGGGGLCTVASIHYNLFLGSLLDHDHDHRRDLGQYTAMRRVGTFLCTELDHGNDAAGLETTAELDRETGGFTLHTPHPGARKFMPNTSPTGGPKSAVVAARLLIDGRDHGVYLFHTPLSDEHGPLPGVHVHPLPLRPDAPVDHCLTTFHRLRLPPEALLQADHGRLTPEHTLTSNLGNRRKRFLHSIARVTTGKLCMSAAAVGASRAALAIAVHYGQHRRSTGPRPDQHPTVNTHRSHHSRLLTQLATAYAMTFLHRSVLQAWAQHTPHNRTHTEHRVATAKAWITWNARTIATEARERCGAQGLMPANHLASLAPYIEGTITAEGDNLLICTKAAAELLLQHPTMPPPTAPTSTDQLADPHHLRALLAHAEAIWHTRARTALRHNPPDAPPSTPQARWNRTSTAALTMLDIHTTLHATDAYLAALDTLPPTTRTHGLLKQLCTLFLLNQLHHHSADLLADEHLSPQQVRHLPTLTDSLHNDLAPHLTTLVNAFDLPRPYLCNIPIAHGATAY